MKKLSIAFFAALLFAACNKPLPQANYDVIPQPKEVHQNKDESKAFTLKDNTVIYYENGLQREAQFLSEYVNDIMGYALKVQESQGQPDGIVLKLVPDDFDYAEAYEINITPKQVEIIGSDAAGVFYGIQTLRKSLPVSPIDSRHPAIPSGNDMGEPNSQLSTINSQLTLNSKLSTLN